MKTSEGFKASGSGAESFGGGFAAALQWVKEHAAGSHELKWAVTVTLGEPEPDHARRDPGTGDMFDDATRAAAAKDAKGDVEIVGRPALDDKRYEVVCPECNGSKETLDEKDGLTQTCKTCGGVGVVKASVIGDVAPTEPKADDGKQPEQPEQPDGGELN